MAYPFNNDRMPVLRLLGGMLLAVIAAPTLTAQFFNPDPDRPPRPDPKRIINEAMGFLREREPELSEEESALYENARNQKPALAIGFIENLLVATKTKKAASPAFNLLLGNIHYAAGAVDKAEEQYLKAVERYPTFLRAWTNLGLLHYAEARYEKAIQPFATAVSLGTREPAVLGLMGECLEKTGDPVGAEVAYVQALAADPGAVRWMEGLLRVYLAGEQYPRAEVMVRRLIKLRPRETRHWLTYARLMHAIDRKLEAIALLEQTLSTGIAGEQEHLELAGLYAEQGLVGEALEAYARIKTDLAGLDETRLLDLARMHLSRSEWARAQALIDKAATKTPGERSPALLLTQAELHSAQKQWTAARRVLGELLQQEPMNGQALVLQGRAYAAEGDTSRATMSFENALQTRDGLRAASIELASLELRTRHFAKCVSLLETALAVEKSQELEELLERVKTLVPAGGGLGS